MKKIIIQKGQFLEDIAPLIPTNIILLKTLTGIGATTLEIKTKRNSIIMEANVPVIKGKKRKGILCIYEGVTVDRVIDYMASTIKYKKILVTPESFFKVKEAAEYLNVNIYRDYFFMFDECDRITKDVNFRKTITLPLDDFFQFEAKALVSATALIPSDPRFAEQNFEVVVIEPDFDYSKKINLVTTNNVFLFFKSIIEKHPDQVICVFFNSTNLIGSYVRKLGINQFTNIFCSSESAIQLKTNGFINVSDSLKELKQINFFTSRFFSAVDIVCDVKPVVILLTDCINGIHSKIHPSTEAIQAIGRFRQGVNEIYHISNTNSEFEQRSEDEIRGMLRGYEQSYQDIRALMQATNDKAAKYSFKKALEYIPFSDFINEDESKNHFMVDNFFLENEIEGCYSSEENLINAYNIPHFKATHFNEVYPLTDTNESKLRAGISMRTVIENIVQALKETETNTAMYTMDNRLTVYQELRKSFPEIVQAYHELGEEELMRNGYSKRQLSKAMKLKCEANEKSTFGFIDALHSRFSDGMDYASSICRDLLQQAINMNSLSLKPTFNLLSQYFELSKRKTLYRTNDGREVKGYTIVRSKFRRK